MRSARSLYAAPLGRQHASSRLVQIRLPLPVRNCLLRMEGDLCQLAKVPRKRGRPAQEELRKAKSTVGNTLQH